MDDADGGGKPAGSGKEGERVVVKQEQDGQGGESTTLAALPMPGGGGALGGSGGVKRLGSVRQGGPDLTMRPPGSKSKFAPKIPAKLAIVKPEPVQDEAASSSRDAERGKGGGRGGGERGGRERGRGQSRPQAPAVVTFRGTAASPHANKSGGGGSGRGGGSGDSGKAGGRGGRGGAARSKPRSQDFMADDLGDNNDIEIDVENSILPTTLPIAPRPPWDPDLIDVQDFMSVKAIKKLVRSISLPAAREVLGESRVASILRNEPWTLAALDITPELMRKLQSRRLRENPMEMSKASTDLFGSQGKRDGDTSLENEIAASGARTTKVDCLFNTRAADMLLLEEEEKERLLFFQLPSSLPFAHRQQMQHDSMDVDEAGEDGENNAIPQQPKNPLSGQPAGWMGKMRVHKSGKVTLKLGDGVFDISEAAQCNFLQQVVARTNDTDDLHHLGNIFGRLLVTPDLDALLKSVQ